MREYSACTPRAQQYSSLFFVPWLECLANAALLFSSKLACNKELTLFVEVAAVIFHSPVRLRPVIGVMTGAHYRTLLMFFTSSHKATCFAGTLLIDKIYRNNKICSFCLRMCIFCCNFEHLPWLYSTHEPFLNKANSLVATFARCSPYFRTLAYFIECGFAFIELN